MQSARMEEREEQVEEVTRIYPAYLISEHVSISRSSEPLASHGDRVQATGELVEETGVAWGEGEGWSLGFIIPRHKHKGYLVRHWRTLILFLDVPSNEIIS